MNEEETDKTDRQTDRCWGKSGWVGGWGVGRRKE